MAVSWKSSPEPEGYEAAVARMEAYIAAMRGGTAEERVWLLEHPALYTAGASAKSGDLLDATALPIHPTGRGGQYTYHGPGQRIAYVMLDLRRRGRDVRAHVHNLESWLIGVLAGFGIEGRRWQGNIGVWVDRGGGSPAKIAAIGVRVRHWITYHGIALNVCPDLGHYRGIVPCGVRGAGVTSLADLGMDAGMAEVDLALQHCFTTVFDDGEDLRPPLPAEIGARSEE
jgi:lipoyl(octanoyl) transferase